MIDLNINNFTLQRYHYGNIGESTRGYLLYKNYKIDTYELSKTGINLCTCLKDGDYKISFNNDFKKIENYETSIFLNDMNDPQAQPILSQCVDIKQYDYLKRIVFIKLPYPFRIFATRDYDKIKVDKVSCCKDTSFYKIQIEAKKTWGCIGVNRKDINIFNNYMLMRNELIKDKINILRIV